MGRKRSLYVASRPLEDDKRLDCITTRVKPVAVLQDNYEYVTVLQSSTIRRQPFYIDEGARLRQELKSFEPTIYPVPPGCKYCGQCGEFRKMDRFSPDKRNKDGLHSTCKQCRADHERKLYWLSKDRPSFAYN